MHSNKVVAIWCLARFYTFASLCLSSCYCAHGKSYFQASFDPETRTRTHHVYVCVCDRMRYVIVVRTYEFYSIPVPKYSERGPRRDTPFGAFCLRDSVAYVGFYFCALRFWDYAGFTLVECTEHNMCRVEVYLLMF